MRRLYAFLTSRPAPLTLRLCSVDMHEKPRDIGKFRETMGWGWDPQRLSGPFQCAVLTKSMQLQASTYAWHLGSSGPLHCFVGRWNRLPAAEFLIEKPH